MNKKFLILLVMTFCITGCSKRMTNEQTVQEITTQEVSEKTSLTEETTETATLPKATDEIDISSDGDSDHEEKTDESSNNDVIPLEGIYYRNNSGKIVENESDLIKDIEARSSAYLTDIFNYSGYTEDYGEKIYAGQADIEEYPNVKDYYPDTIINAFDELKVNSSTKSVKVLGITMADVKDGKYSALVRGYVETDFSMTDINKDTYYILFKDNIIIDGDQTYHFDTYFSYVFKTDGFSYGLMNDNSNEIRYEGEDIYQFDLESYNPAYDLDYELLE